MSKVNSISPVLVKEFRFEWTGIDIEGNEFTETDTVEVYHIKDNVYLLKICFLDIEIEKIIETSEVTVDTVKKILEQVCKERQDECLDIGDIR